MITTGRATTISTWTKNSTLINSIVKKTAKRESLNLLRRQTKNIPFIVLRQLTGIKCKKGWSTNRLRKLKKIMNKRSELSRSFIWRICKILGRATSPCRYRRRIKLNRIVLMSWLRVRKSCTEIWTMLRSMRNTKDNTRKWPSSKPKTISSIRLTRN